MTVCACIANTPAKTNLSQRQTEIQTRINQGFTWFKTDLDGILSSSDYTTSPDTNPFTESGGSPKRILESGYTKYRDYVASFRSMISDAPLSADHFLLGLPKAAEASLMLPQPFNYPITWQRRGIWIKQRGDGWKTSFRGTITQSMRKSMPVLRCRFFPVKTCLVSTSSRKWSTRERLITSIPILLPSVEYTRADRQPCGAHERGVRTALHQSNSPIAMMMCAHIAAGIPDFLSCEHHYPEISWYNNLIDGVPKPLMVDGYVQIPDGPGLGVTPNDAEMNKHLPWGTTTLWKQLT